MLGRLEYWVMQLARRLARQDPNYLFELEGVR
jgi:hypothetical protein